MTLWARRRAKFPASFRGPVRQENNQTLQQKKTCTAYPSKVANYSPLVVACPMRVPWIWTPSWMSHRPSSCTFDPFRSIPLWTCIQEKTWKGRTRLRRNHKLTPFPHTRPNLNHLQALFPLMDTEFHERAHSWVAFIFFHLPISGTCNEQRVEGTKPRRQSWSQSSKDDEIFVVGDDDDKEKRRMEK